MIRAMNVFLVNGGSGGKRRIIETFWIESCGFQERARGPDDDLHGHFSPASLIELKHILARL
jgi:hypothetical protein